MVQAGVPSRGFALWIMPKMPPRACESADWVGALARSGGGNYPQPLTPEYLVNDGADYLTVARPHDESPLPKGRHAISSVKLCFYAFQGVDNQG